jgi:hypothetical protein
MSGMSKLDSLERKRPRKGLRSANRAAKRESTVERAIKRLLMLYKNWLQIAFLKWGKGTRMQTQREDLVRKADQTFELPAIQKAQMAILRKPLRTGFKKIKSLDRQIA